MRPEPPGPPRNMPRLSTACHALIEVPYDLAPRLPGRPAPPQRRLVTTRRRDYGALPRRQTLRADSPGRFARRATRGLKAGRGAEADGWGPGLEPGRQSCPPRLPWFSRVPCPWIRLRGDGCAHGPPAPSRQSDRRTASPARPCLGPPRLRGRSRVTGAETRRAHPGPVPPCCAVRGPPSEDCRRRMPRDAAPRIHPRPGPAISLRRRPRRGAEHRRP